MYDLGGKWLIQHYGDSLLRLGGVQTIASWRALQAEVVQPSQLPDGLIEVKRSPKAKPEYFLVEVAARPEKRLLRQVLRGMTLVYLDRRVLPEVLTVILHPGGYQTIPDRQEVKSRRQWTHWQMQWKVVRLWELNAVALLGTGDLGVIPWVPLTKFLGPPGPILEECRRRIEASATPEERANLLVVTQILARLRYNDPKLLEILGGAQAVRESPLIVDLVASNMQKVILRFLAGRFGPEARDVQPELEPIKSEAKLEALVDLAAACPDLESFRRGIPKPPRKRKGRR
jgi:hypothetical protein